METWENNLATETLATEFNAGGRIDANQETDAMTEKTISNADILRPKLMRRVGCWNVRTLNQTGKIAEVTREMNNYSIELLGVSETRWTGSGEASCNRPSHPLLRKN